MNETKSSLAILLSTDILAYWNTVVSPFVLLYLYIFVVSITVIELGRIMRSPEGILTLILNFMNLQSSERSTMGDPEGRPSVSGDCNGSLADHGECLQRDPRRRMSEECSVCGCDPCDCDWGNEE